MFCQMYIHSLNGIKLNILLIICYLLMKQISEIIINYYKSFLIAKVF